MLMAEKEAAKEAKEADVKVKAKEANGAETGDASVKEDGKEGK